jgi:hypothetical protein
MFSTIHIRVPLDKGNVPKRVNESNWLEFGTTNISSNTTINGIYFSNSFNGYVRNLKHDSCVRNYNQNCERL